MWDGGKETPKERRLVLLTMAPTLPEVQVSTDNALLLLYRQESAFLMISERPLLGLAMFRSLDANRTTLQRDNFLDLCVCFLVVGGGGGSSQLVSLLTASSSSSRPFCARA